MLLLDTGIGTCRESVGHPATCRSIGEQEDHGRTHPAWRPAVAGPGAPPPALVGVAPAPWHDVFTDAGVWASDPIVVSGGTLGGMLGNAGVTRSDDGMVTGPHAGLTGLYQTVWHRALSNPASSTQLFAGAPEYFGLHF